MNTRPTLKEIASMTGMSITTISRALSDPQKVKYSTRLKIESALKELQWQNQKEKSGIIGIIFPDISNQFFPLMLTGIENASAGNDNIIMLCNSNGDIKMEERFLRKLLDIRADGIIYIATEKIPTLLKDIIDNDIIPVIFLDRNPGLENISLITTDNRNGMYQATKYLITLGHRKILYLGGKIGTSTNNDRFAGFMEAIMESDIPINNCRILNANFSNSDAFKIIKEDIQKEGSSYTAIAAANDAMALGAMKALKSEKVKVPETVSIIGYDDIPSSAIAGLTTIRQPFIEMGRTAFLNLLASIADPKTPKKTIVLSSSIVFRNSCSILR